MSFQDKYRCIYIHIPKTGGTSIIRSLFGVTPYNHYSALEMRALYGNSYSRYYKFAFVRNPWDRLYSTYNFLKSDYGSPEDVVFRKELDANYSSFNEFVINWLSEKNIWSNFLFFPQYFFLPRSLSQLDYIGRFEDLEKDFQYIKRKIGISNRLLHLNSSKKEARYQDVYSEEAWTKVYNVYNRDIKLLGYI